MLYLFKRERGLYLYTSKHYTYLRYKYRLKILFLAVYRLLLVKNCIKSVNEKQYDGGYYEI